MSETISGEIDWRATLFGTRAPGWSILVRFLVGLVVCLPEGIQKLAFPDILGAGCFANIGSPYPELMGPFVGIVEIICGTLIILGLLTRLAAIPLIIIMIVAIVSTKVPILLGMISGFSICPSCPATASGPCCTKRARISICCWVLFTS